MAPVRCTARCSRFSLRVTDAAPMARSRPRHNDRTSSANKEGRRSTWTNEFIEVLEGSVSSQLSVSDCRCARRSLGLAEQNVLLRAYAFPGTNYLIRCFPASARR